MLERETDIVNFVEYLHKNHIIVLTKNDLHDNRTDHETRLKISVKENYNLKKLQDEILENLSNL